MTTTAFLQAEIRKIEHRISLNRSRLTQILMMIEYDEAKLALIKKEKAMKLCR